jgi:hypothetical protein
VFIYKITLNNKYVYYGKALNVAERIKRHENELNKGIHHNIVMQRIWDKYRNLSHEILYSDLSNEDANKVEIDLISNNVCINIAAGGTGGDTISNHPNREEICKKISAGHTGVYSDEWKAFQGTMKDRAEVLWGAYTCVKCNRDIKGKANFLRYHGANGEKCGVPRPAIVCPHCGKIGSQPGSMAYRHFDNCPKKVINE